MSAECGVSARGPARVGTFDMEDGAPLCGEVGRTWSPSPSPGEPFSAWAWVAVLGQMTASFLAILTSHSAELGCREVWQRCRGDTI